MSLPITLHRESLHPWWKSATIYQIYPSSFQDSNSDGIGDLKGIISRLPYLQSLGIDAIWICPIYQSPQVDMGYDISDYKKIHPPYGTVEDVEELVEGCQERGIRVVMDLVANHTSDQHEWFRESRRSKRSEKRDWYIWKPARISPCGQRLPPNNWRSAFGGSAWTWDPTTEEFYLHLFAPEQPDLNWENPDVRQAMYDEAMIFWLEKGISGFRIDCANLMSKPPGLPDADVTVPGEEWQDCSELVCNGPRIMEYLDGIAEVLGRYGAVSIGETSYIPNLSTVLEYVGARHRRLNMVFQFDVIEVGTGKSHRYDIEPHSWKLSELKEAVSRTQTFLKGTDGWTTAYLENHDLARCVSRFGDDSPEWRERSAKMLALFLTSLSGTLFVYQGQEIGMVNLPKEWGIEEYQDVGSINYYNAILDRHGTDSEEVQRAMRSLQHLARDHSRSPMQWNPASRNGGFTEENVKPWMRVNGSTKEINVVEQEGREDSVLGFWKRMLKVRKEYEDVLIFGEFELVDEGNQKVFSFLKQGKERSALVVCNFSGERVEVPGILREGSWSLLVGNVEGDGTGELEEWEGRIYIESEG